MLARFNERWAEVERAYQEEVAATDEDISDSAPAQISVRTEVAKETWDKETDAFKEQVKSDWEADWEETMRTFRMMQVSPTTPEEFQR